MVGAGVVFAVWVVVAAAVTALGPLIEIVPVVPPGGGKVMHVTHAVACLFILLAQPGGGGGMGRSLAPLAGLLTAYCLVT